MEGRKGVGRVESRGGGDQGDVTKTTDVAQAPQNKLLIQQNLGDFASNWVNFIADNIRFESCVRLGGVDVEEVWYFVLQHQMNPSSNFGSYRASLRAALWRAQGAVDDREKVRVCVCV